MAIGLLTTIGKNEALNALVSTNGTLYIGLLTNGVEETGAGSGGTPYARKAITFGASSSGVKASTTSITFSNGGATDWGSALDEWGIYDALTGGNQLATGALDAIRNMSLAGADIIFPIGSVTLALSD